MKNSINDHFWQKKSFLVFLLSLSVGTLTQIASANTSKIPDSIKTPDDQQFLFKTSAKGSQIYVCQANENRFEWTLKGPKAVLINAQGKQFGRHYLGPSWEANDGSKIVGQIKAKTDAPQTNAIPWLLLKANSHQGNGVFDAVNWIVRLNTTGGMAPTDGCDRDRQNREVSVNYTADYYFYGASSHQ